MKHFRYKSDVLLTAITNFSSQIRAIHPYTSSGLAGSGLYALACTAGCPSALGVDAPDGVVWFWIGSHADYDKLIGG